MSARRPGSPNRGLILTCFLAVVVIVGSFLLRPQPERAIDESPPRSEPTPTSEPEPDPRLESRSGSSGPSERLGDAARAERDGPFPGLGVQPGIEGSGRTASLPSHRLTIRLTSPNPIGQTAYFIPTSAEHAKGSAVVSGGSWSLSTTVYGRPDYAVVFLQAGADGRPATCEITVDGRVTDRRSTRGPYGTLWCQG